ncbi:MAG: hypothetical protein ACPKOI_03375 [Pleomorphochaeta sp.]
MDFLSIANSLGPITVIILLLIIVIMLLQKYKEISEKNAQNLEKHIDEQKEIDKEQEDKINFLSQHYVTKEEMFQQVGGWRAELTAVNQNILHLTELISTENNK